MLYVIIPVYNCEKYLEAAVDSVLAQPFNDIQIVITDDGSTDASGEIADSLREQHDSVTVLHQENRGVSSARNAGIDYVLRQDAAQNGYIAFLDADDLWARNAIDDGIAALMNSQEYDLLCFNRCHVNEDLTRSDVPSNFETTSFPGGVKSVYRHQLHFGSVLYSIQLLEKYDLHFFDGMPHNEDEVFKMCCFYLANQIFRSPRVLYLYRKNTRSTSHIRAKGIPCFMHIIEIWPKMDAAMYCWKNNQRGELREGRTLASVYMLEMAQEHYLYFGRRKELEKALTEHPHYSAFLALKENCVTPKQYAEYLLLKDHPVRFQLKYYCLGIVRAILVAAMRVPLVTKAYERKKYPIINKYV